MTGQLGVLIVKLQSHISRNFAAIALVAGVGAAILPLAGGTEQSRPNLIFVFSDQHSWDMLGCYGNPDVQTPNLDELAKQGVRFRHCISNSPVCTPYRGMLLTGQHPLRCGAIQNDLQILPGKGAYLAEQLRDAGYRLGYFGKWHLYGGDRDRGIPPGPYRYGFDHEFLTNNCTLVYDVARSFYWDQAGEEKKFYGDWEPYAQTRQAIEFVDQHAKQPLALFLSWHPPHNWESNHAGYDAPGDLLSLYDPKTITLRPTAADTLRVRSMYQGHMAMITGIDRAFGALMETLKQHNLVDNTIVVFTSDHGDMLMSYGWSHNKGRAEHLSCRVPLLIRWPKRLQPHVSDLLIGTLDLMPTLLGLLDLPVPKTCQGRDASQALLAQRADSVDAQPLFFMPLNWRGVYTHRFTYSIALHPPAEANMLREGKTFNVLYDRQKDPWETQNLFGDPGYVEIQQTLHAKTLELMSKFGDEGLECNQLLRRVVRAEDYEQVMTAPPARTSGWEGRLRSSPLEVLSTSSQF